MLTALLLFGDKNMFTAEGWTLRYEILRKCMIPKENDSNGKTPISLFPGSCNSKSAMTHKATN